MVKYTRAFYCIVFSLVEDKRRILHQNAVIAKFDKLRVWQGEAYLCGWSSTWWWVVWHYEGWVVWLSDGWWSDTWWWVVWHYEGWVVWLYDGDLTHDCGWSGIMMVCGLVILWLVVCHMIVVGLSFLHFLVFPLIKMGNKANYREI